MSKLFEIARGAAVDAIKDLSHDVMGCAEVLEDELEGLDDAEADRMVEVYALHLWEIAEWIEDNFETP